MRQNQFRDLGGGAAGRFHDQVSATSIKRLSQAQELLDFREAANRQHRAPIPAARVLLEAPIDGRRIGCQPNRPPASAKQSSVLGPQHHSTAGRNHLSSLVTDSFKDHSFLIAKASLTFLGKNLPNAAAVALFQESVRIHEAPTELLGEALRYRRLSGPAVADEEDIMDFGLVRALFRQPVIVHGSLLLPWLARDHSSSWRTTGDNARVTT